MSVTLPTDAAPICTTGVGDNRGTDWLLVGFALVRGLFLSAKHLFFAALQAFAMGGA